MLHVVLYVLAVVCFAAAAFGLNEGGKINLTALGLLCWVLTNLI